MKCKLTGHEGKGVKAHIIPLSFYNIDPEERFSTKLFTNTKGHYSKKAPKGVFDTTIVTEQGERLFSEWDNYGAKLLLENKSKFQPLTKNGVVAGYQVPQYSYTKLKLFFLSVLWRASVSSHIFFSKVKLGPHENIIQEALLQKNPGEPDWYSVILARWSDQKEGGGILDPYREKYDDVNFYRLYMDSYIVYIKVDKRKASRKFQAFQLSPEMPLTIVAREFKTSKELNLFLKMLKSDA